MGDVSYHSLDTNKNWKCLIGNLFSRHVPLKAYLRYPLKSRTHNSSSILAEVKQTSMHKSTKFSASKLVQRSLMFAQTGYTRYHKTSLNKIGLAYTCQYIEGFTHSVFAENTSLHQVKDLGTQIQNLSRYSVELFPSLKKCSAIPNLIRMLSHSQFQNKAELFPDQINYWSTPCLITFFRYTLSYYKAELFPILLHCWCVSCLITLQKYSKS